MLMKFHFIRAEPNVAFLSELAQCSPSASLAALSSNNEAEKDEINPQEGNRNGSGLRYTTVNQTGVGWMPRI